MRKKCHFDHSWPKYFCVESLNSEIIYILTIILWFWFESQIEYRGTVFIYCIKLGWFEDLRRNLNVSKGKERPEITLFSGDESVSKNYF